MVPERVQHARHLRDFCSDARQVFFIHAGDVDLNVKDISRSELGDDPPRNNVQILEALEDPSDGAGIRLSGDAQTK